MKIRKLRIRVKISRGAISGVSQRSASPTHPSLKFDLPNLAANTESSEKVKQVTEDRDEGQRIRTDGTRLDPRKVAESVYEIMVEEVRIARSRGNL